METLTSWNPVGHSRPVPGLLYLLIWQKGNIFIQPSGENKVKDILEL